MNAELFQTSDDTTELLDQVGADMAPDNKWPTTLAEMVDVLVMTFARAGVERDAALSQAQQAVVAIGQYLGGRSIYLPRGDQLVTAVRDRRIWIEWRGNNMQELMDRYGLTERHLQRVLAEQRAIHVRRIQPGLFKDEG